MLPSSHFFKGTPSAFKKKVYVYCCFQNKDTYDLFSRQIKQNILSCEIEYIIYCINCVKNLLTCRDLNNARDIEIIEGGQALEVDLMEKEKFQLDQYSKFLALRFVREVLFEASYPFMLLTFVELNDIFRGIAMYRKKNEDQQVAQHMFEHGEFLKYKKKNRVSQYSDLDVKRISLSIHLLVVEIVRISGSIYKLLPFHEKYAEAGPNISSFFQNPFFKLCQELPINKKEIYLQDKDRFRYMNIYKGVSVQKSVKYFYYEMFQYIWAELEVYDDEEREEAFEDFDWKTVPDKFRHCVNSLVKIANSVNDRYFWGYFKMFLAPKLQKLKDHLKIYYYGLNQKYRNINKLLFFMNLFVYRCIDPQIIRYLTKSILEVIVEHHKQLLQECCADHERQLAKPVQRSRRGSQYFEYSRTRQNSNRNHLDSIAERQRVQSLICSINFFIVLRESSYLLYNQLKCQDYWNITFYVEAMLANIPSLGLVLEKILKFNTIREDLSQIVKVRQNWNHKKEVYLKMTKQAMTTFSELSLKKKQIEKQIKTILEKHKFISIVNVYTNQLCEEDIKIEAVEISEAEVEYIRSRTERSNNSSSRFKLSTSRQQEEQYSLPSNIGNGSQQSEQSIGSIEGLKRFNTSFKESLRVERGDPQRTNKEFALLKSLSKKKNTRNGLSLSRDKNSNKQSSHKKLSIVIPPSPAKLKQAILLEERRESLKLRGQTRTTPRNKLFNQEQSYQLLNDQPTIKTPQTTVKPRFTTKNSFKNTEAKFSTKNKIVLNISQHEPPPLPSSAILDKNNKANIQRLEGEKSQILLNSKIMAFEQQKVTEMIPVPGSRELSESNESFCVDEAKSRVESSYLRQILEPDRQKTEQSNIYFCFLPRTKRELLKEKVLVQRNNALEVGMTTQLRNRKSLSREANMRISVFILAGQKIGNVSVNIICPSWLVCNGRTNSLIDLIPKSAQKISHFDVQLNRSENISFKIPNFVAFPILNITYYIGGQRYTLVKAIPYLISKFLVEKRVEKNQEEKIFSLKEFKDIVKVHEKVAESIDDLKEYYREVSRVKIDRDKFHLPIVDRRDVRLNGEIGLVILEFVPLGEELLITFMQSRMDSYSWPSKAKTEIFVDVRPIRRQKWDFALLHIVTTCLKSIYSSS